MAKSDITKPVSAPPRGRAMCLLHCARSGQGVRAGGARHRVLAERVPAGERATRARRAGERILGHNRGRATRHEEEKDISVTFANGVLTIRGEKKQVREENGDRERACLEHKLDRSSGLCICSARRERDCAGPAADTRRCEVRMDRTHDE